MPVKYFIRKYPLSAGTGQYTANVISSGTADLNQVAEYMTELGSTVTKADILSVMEDFQKALEALLAQGINVNTPFANYSLSIKGTFEDPSVHFDPSRHRVSINVNTGIRLKKFSSAKLKVLREEPGSRSPLLSVFSDVNSGINNNVITPGGLASLEGYRLKFDVNDNRQGIFLFNNSDATSYRIGVVGLNMPGRLIFTLPAGLTPGSYTIQVTALFGAELRIGKLRHTLTVSAPA